MGMIFLMDKKSFDIIVKHKMERVCKLYFDLQEEYQEEFEKLSLFDDDWNRMVRYSTGDYEEIDSHDMTIMNRIWKTYNKYKKEGKVYNVWDDIDEFLREGKKINAIKLYRERFGTGLKESKEAVDNRYMRFT